MRSLAALALAGVCLSAPRPARAETALAHNVFFALHDGSEGPGAQLVAACKKYLTGYEGTVFFAVGTVANELDRPVNDRDFDVSLHVYFKDKAAHDRYQEAPRHKQFIAEQQGNWKKVRVFDSWVEAGK
jgi:hypothetical protein